MVVDGRGLFFSTLTPAKTTASLGEADSYRTHVLRENKTKFSSASVFRPVATFIDEKERDEWQAHSWLFLHYLLSDSSIVSRERANEFLRAVADGAGAGGDAVEIRAFYEQLLGASFDELDKVVERYRRRANFKVKTVKVPSLPDAESFSVRAVGAKEIRLRLADLSLRLQRSGRGRFALLNATEEGDPRVFEALGTDAWMEQNPRQAHERWLSALELGSDNPAIFHWVGIMETEERFKYFDPYFRLDAANANRLRDFFHRSIQRTPTQSLAYERLAWIESAAPEPDVRNLELVESKFATLEQQAGVAVALGLAYLQLGDETKTSAWLERVWQLKPDRRVEQMLERLKKGRVRAVGP